MMSGVWPWNLHVDTSLLGHPDVQPDLGTRFGNPGLSPPSSSRKNPFKVQALVDLEMEGRQRIPWVSLTLGFIIVIQR